MIPVFFSSIRMILLECQESLALKKGYCSTNNVEYEFWPCIDNTKHCVSGSKKKHVLEQHIVPNTWMAKVGTNLSKEDVLALEDVEFQLQQREELLSCHRLSTIASFFVPRSHFRLPILMPIQLQVREDNASQSNNTNKCSQKQMGEYWTHGWSLRRWNHCKYVSRVWSVNQHHLQGGYWIMCYNW